MDTPRPRSTRPSAGKLALAALAGALAAVTIALASCGAGRPPGSVISRTPAPTSTAGGATETPGNGGTPTGIPQPTSYAYLYSRIDYPQQIAVNAGDTVTLILSPHRYILSVTPSAGHGTGTVSEPIPLPTDLQDYQDIVASVETAGTGRPLTWALTSASHQSLLTSPDPTAVRDYREVDFTWRVTAVAAGANAISIVLHLTYVYLNGQQQVGTIQMQAPVPIVVVQPALTQSVLPELKLPIASLSGLAGIIAILKFIYNALKTVSSVTEPVKDAAKVAQVVHGRLTATRDDRVGQAQGQERWGVPPQTQPRPPGPSSPPAAAAPHEEWPTWLIPRQGNSPPQQPPFEQRGQRPWPPIPDERRQ